MLLTLIERYVVCAKFVCWLRADIVPLSVVLGALGSLCLFSILTIHSVSYPRPRRFKRRSGGPRFAFFFSPGRVEPTKNPAICGQPEEA
jgi:hypothetical protein